MSNCSELYKYVVCAHIQKELFPKYQMSQDKIQDSGSNSDHQWPNGSSFVIKWNESSGKPDFGFRKRKQIIEIDF